jgi:hypothetical protein
MLTQTRKFISLSDIFSFRFLCKTCGVEMSLPLREEDFNKARATHKCPNCRDYWLLLNETASGNAVPALEKFVQSIRALSEWPGQCQISLEIRPEQEPT